MSGALLLLNLVTLWLPALADVDASWKTRVADLTWVAYAPTQANPHQGVEASPDAIADDLAILRKAGFDGLVTYSCGGTFGQHIADLAEAAGFKGAVLGVWDPNSTAELSAAGATAQNKIVMGYSVGNEGLGKRYDLPALRQAINALRERSGKPVTTTEELDDYSDPALCALGDWVFPNAHPFWHDRRTAKPALQWTRQAYHRLADRCDRLVWFKEVGLPSSGDPAASEAAQASYYAQLERSDVQFVYFEAFDQPWKTHQPCEPHWGLFKADRSPKLVTQQRMDATPQARQRQQVSTSPARDDALRATTGLTGRQPSRVLQPAELERIESLISAMSLQEKLGQLTQQWGGEIQDVNPVVTDNKQGELDKQVRAGLVGSYLGAFGAAYTNRLQKIAVEESPHGIPLIIGNDVIHGYRTIMPIPFAEACTWDPALIHRAAQVAATEARAAGTHWTFAPMVDICRDPRWGRIAEGAGEDPYLGAIVAAARVRGFQGNDFRDPDSVLACAKHFAAYGAAEGGRDYNTVNLSERALREIHLPPFAAAVDAGTATLMTAFNEINGIPASAHPLIMQQILRGEWGFDGFVVSDWNSIGEMVAHGFARDGAHAAELSLRTGVDMDMSSFLYRTHLGGAVQRGVIDEDRVDVALRRILRMKTLLGLFDNPYVDLQNEKTVTLCDEHRAAAREIARASMVLLKNDDILPLADSLSSIAVIGPLADSRKDPLGTWAGQGKPEDVIPAIDGLRARFGAERIRHARGCGVTEDDRGGFDEAVQLARDSAAVVMIMGESENLSGEAHCRSKLDLPGVQRELIEAVLATGRPTVVVILSGRPLSIPWLAEHAPAILMAWHPGVECGPALADVLSGDFNPSGHLVNTVPRHVGQIPIYHAHKNTGRPPNDTRYTSKYIDLPSTPLYPFGYGLSYTTFTYDELVVSPQRIGPEGQVEVRVTVRNTGQRAGHDVVQLYFRDAVASVTRPIRELAGFQRLHLEPGASRQVIFTLDRRQLSFLDANLEAVVEPGRFEVWVGADATAPLRATFEVVTP